MSDRALEQTSGRRSRAIVFARKMFWSSTGFLDRFARDDCGNLMIISAITLPIAIMTVGAAVSFSTGNATRASLQTALDSAVLAGAIVLDTAASPNALETAQIEFDSNVNNFAHNSAAQIQASYMVEGSVVYGSASAYVKNPFGGFVGTKTYSVNVTSAATKQTIPLCVLGLNGLDNGAFDINGGPTFNADCAVQANSNSTSGMTQEGKSANVKAAKFGITGGHKTDSFSPAPTDGSPKIADPYASVPFPFHDDCSKSGGNGLDVKTDTTLSPGTYCGGLHINGNGTIVNMQPGIYVMVDGPFWVNGSAVVKGDQVMIAFTGTGAALQVWGDATVKLTSPKSGAYTNFQFFQDRDDLNSRGAWDSVGGNVILQIDGISYFPTQNLWVYGNAVLNANSPSMAVVADKIWTQGNATFNVTHNNPRNLTVSPVPTTTYSSRLVE